MTTENCHLKRRPGVGVSEICASLAALLDVVAVYDAEAAKQKLLEIFKPDGEEENIEAIKELSTFKKESLRPQQYAVHFQKLAERVRSEKNHLEQLAIHGMIASGRSFLGFTALRQLVCALKDPKAWSESVPEALTEDKALGKWKENPADLTLMAKAIGKLLCAKKDLEGGWADEGDNTAASLFRPSATTKAESPEEQEEDDDEDTEKEKKSKPAPKKSKKTKSNKKKRKGKDVSSSSESPSATSSESEKQKKKKKKAKKPKKKGHKKQASSTSSDSAPPTKVPSKSAAAGGATSATEGKTKIDMASLLVDWAPAECAAALTAMTTLETQKPGGEAGASALETLKQVVHDIPEQIFLAKDKGDIPKKILSLEEFPERGELSGILKEVNAILEEANAILEEANKVFEAQAVEATVPASQGKLKKRKTVS